MRALLVALPLVLMVLAGCSDSGGKEAAVFKGRDLKATDTTGVIRGLALSEAVVPLVGVAISATGPAGNVSRATTDDLGIFTFEGLEPGAYLVEASKPGYFSASGTTIVEAGVNEPKVVKLILREDPLTRPYATVSTWDGYVECSGRLLVPYPTGGTPLYNRGQNVCASLPDDVSEDNAFYTMTFDPKPTALHAEMLWTNTQNLGSGLTLVVGPPTCEDVKYGRSDGPSPRILQLNATVMADEELNITAGEDGGVCYRVFTWVADEAGGVLGVTVQQKFTAYFVSFYNFEPTLDYSFSADGAPKPPA